MGAELISAVIEIAKDIEPNWVAAENHIKNLPDVEAANLYSEILQLGDEYEAEDLNENDLVAVNARKSFITALDECKSGWEGHHRLLNKMHLRDSIILLAAGETWGDNIETCDIICLFDGCGAAKEAGFY